MVFQGVAYKKLRQSKMCKKQLFFDLCLSCFVSAYAESWHKESGIYAKFDGTIVVGEWMCDMCENEDELAAIVAHEKAHLVLKHGEKAWYEKVGGWFAGWFVDESKPRFRGPPDPKSIARENEADEKGLMLMAEAGYDPQAAVDFWTRYYERTGWWEGDGTHPKPRERLAHLNALMPKAKETYWSACSTKAALASTTIKKGAQ